jgi:hypothetical protein
LQEIERALRRADRLGGHLGVAGGRGQAGVPEQNLDQSHVHPVLQLQQAGREGVAQGVNRHRLVQKGRGAGRTASGVQHHQIEWMVLGSVPKPVAGDGPE